eukprot:gnl/MRDRNA2_/MRDRNA2_78993_c0_seq1.p1 gnl/MRDRNA2_/MRDRNA2_78993_c0~~gnl/MRDRNA2_/MRDRNA2_78993_c0_seq1.p1  ORF type:complete len:700 (-),score=131.11 gnl/MRDRNA2_/MRDRNA2_78993_c0_seq1:34-2133(-)
MKSDFGQLFPGAQGGAKQKTDAAVARRKRKKAKDKENKKKRQAQEASQSKNKKKRGRKHKVSAVNASVEKSKAATSPALSGDIQAVQQSGNQNKASKRQIHSAEETGRKLQKKLQKQAAPNGKDSTQHAVGQHLVDVHCGEKRASPRTVELNKQLQQCAQHKQLTEAHTIFLQLQQEGLCNSYSYSIMMNVCARCDDADGADAALRVMRGAGLRPEVVAYGTVLKARCSAGNIEGAMELIREMGKEKPPVKPNVRIVNTFLRGCMLVGAVEEASLVLAQMQKDWCIMPDASTIEYMVVLLCQALHLDKAVKLVTQHAALLEKEPWTAVCIARAAALLNRHQDCQKYLERARKLLSDSQVKENVTEWAGHASSSGPQLAEASGGRRAWHEMDEARQRSNLAFRHNKYHSMRQEVEAIQNFTDKQVRFKLGKSLRRVLLCRGLGGTASGKEICVGLVSALSVFGLQTEAQMNKMQGVFESCVNLKGKISLPALFEDPSLPLKLEVCSGMGEWVCAHAKHEQGMANWVALEWRYDRVHQTFVRAALADISNLLMLGGDASLVLPQRIKARTVDAVFVNHPEPPQQTGADGIAPQGRHLLTSTFFKEVSRILRPRGTFTILSDNLWYSRFLLKTLAGLESGLFCEGRCHKKKNVNKREGQFTLFEGKPGSEYGHTATASSYFDGLWNASDKRSRYFLYVEKPE